MGRLTYSASGAVASFKAAGHVPVRHAKFNFTPTQDLHGQSAPYPAGGGINQWDEVWEEGSINTSTGQNMSSSGKIRSKNYIPVLPNTSYHIHYGSRGEGSDYVYLYDSGKNFIEYKYVATNVKEFDFTTGSNTYYIRFTSNNDTYNHDISINYPSTDTAYHPYSNICPISGWTGLTGYKDSKHGGMIQWNQLVRNGNFANTNDWVVATTSGSFSVANNIATVQLNSGVDYAALSNYTQTAKTVSGHKYLLSVDVKSDSWAESGNRVIVTYGGWWAITVARALETGTWVTLSLIHDCSVNNSTQFSVRKYMDADANPFQVRNAQLFDLTEMFGVGNEPSTVDEFRAIFPLDYYAYNAGTLTTVDAVNGKTDTMYPITFPALGVNQWDEEWELGTINNNTGENISDNNKYRSKNYIPIISGQAYYFRMGGSYTIGLRWYDINKTFITSGAIAQSALLSIPAGAAYLRFANTTSNTYANDISINYPSTDTSYHPYTNTVYGGYVDLVTGEVISNYGIKILTDNDIQSVTSSYENVVYAVTQIPSDGLRSLSKRGITSITGEAVSIWPFDDSGAIGKCAINAQQEKFWFGFKPGTTLEQAKSILVGVQLAYELATPTLVTTLTPTELQTFIGENHIWSNANGNTAVEYDAHEATEVFLARKRLIEENSPVERTATGAVASFTTRSNLPLKECKFNFTPVQDLHGETAPYPAGGGVNIWDEEWETGQYNPSSGEPQTANNAIRSKNFIPIMPSTTYYCHMPSGVSQRLFWYDSETNWIGTDTNTSFTTPANAQYMKFHTSTGYGGTYNHDISINYPSTDTSYHPYANICPITGWTGANVSRTGKNLCDGMAYIVQLNTGRPYILNQDTHPVSPYTNPNNYGGIGFVAPVKAGETYAMSTDVTGTSTTGEIYYGIYRSLSDATNRENLLQYGWHQREFTSNYDGIVVLMRYNTPSGGEVTWTYAQLELGSTATAYEPYSGNVYHCSFGGLTKNLFDESTMYHGWYNPSSPSDMREDEAYRTAIAELPAGTYTFSTNLPNVYMLRIAIGDENNGNIASTSPLKFTLSEPNTVKICFRKSDSSTITESFNTQIEAGSTATSYEPYGTIYGGYVDPVKGVAVATIEAIHITKFDGAWGAAQNGYAVFKSMRVGKPSNYLVTKSNMFKMSTLAYGLMPVYSYPGSSGLDTIWTFILPSTVTSLQEANAWLGNLSEPLIITAELATPITYQLTPQQIRSLIGQNNVFSDVNGNTTVKYWKL